MEAVNIVMRLFKAMGEDEQKGLADSNQKEDLFAGPVFDKSAGALAEATEFGDGWKV